MKRFLIAILALALSAAPAFAQFDGGLGARPHAPQAYASRNGWALVQSANLGSVSSFTITGLQTTVYDYRLVVRMTRGGGGSAADYITMQAGDIGSTPTLFTTTAFTTALGTTNTNLTTTGGITRIAQVQNNTTLYMGTEVSLNFSNDGTVLSAGAHSYFWENLLQVDQGPVPSQIGSLKIATVNQAWTTSYSLYAIRR